MRSHTSDCLNEIQSSNFYPELINTSQFWLKPIQNHHIFREEKLIWIRTCSLRWHTHIICWAFWHALNGNDWSIQKKLLHSMIAWCFAFNLFTFCIVLVNCQTTKIHYVSNRKISLKFVNWMRKKNFRKKQRKQNKKTYVAKEFLAIFWWTGAHNDRHGLLCNFPCINQSIPICTDTSRIIPVSCF